MAASNQNAVPPSLKSVNIFMKTAQEMASRDPIVAYYCRLYALEKGMEIDKRSPEAREFLTMLMGQLETLKKELSAQHPEVFVTDSLVGQSAVENKAVQLFAFADNKDRSGDFGPATVKAFYTAGVLLDVLQSFGTVNEEFDKCRKYAKWKALYITQCRKNGETPVAGPLGEGEEAPDLMTLGAIAHAQNHPHHVPPQVQPQQPMPPHVQPQQPPHVQPQQPPPQRPISPQQHRQPSPQPAAAAGPPGARIQPGPVYPNLTTEDYTAVMKYAKYAGSAMQYQDGKTAIDYLVKALNRLQTGKD